MFLRACLAQLQRATSEDVPVPGYFHWSAQDNLEWLPGYDDRLGLIYVDFDTLKRTPKLSAQWSGKLHGTTQWSEDPMTRPG